MIIINNQVLDINEFINNDIREKFNLLVDKILSHNNNSFLPNWVERNTLLDPTYENFVYLEFINANIGSDNDSIVLYSNNPVYWYCLKNLCNISAIDTLFFIIISVWKNFLSRINYLRFIAHQVIFIILSKSVSIVDRNIILVQTWVSNSQVEKDTITDVYFEGLRHFLTLKGESCYTWIVPYDSFLKNIKIIIKNRRHNDVFFTQYSFLKFSNILSAIHENITSRRLAFFMINNSNIDSVMHSLFLYQQNIESIYSHNLFGLFIKELSKNNVSISRLIYNCENMTHEKITLCAMKKYFPHAITIGNFHTTKPRNLLCLEYAGPNDYSITPKPSLILHTSSCYLKFFKNKYPKLIMGNGYAFKQKEILFSFKEKQVERGKSKVLLILPGIKSKAINLLEYLSRLDCNHVSFVVRFHPMVVFDISKYILKQTSEVSISSMGLYEEISSANRVIGYYSSVLYEASLIGAHVGLVYDVNKLLFNPFDDTDSYNYSLIRSFDEFRKFILFDSVITKDTMVPYNTSKDLLNNYLN